MAHSKPRRTQKKRKSTARKKKPRVQFKSTLTKALRTKDAIIVGIDEVGRGPVAGPVAVCTLWYRSQDHEYLNKKLVGITDSKKVHVNKRRKYAKIAQDLQDEGTLHYTIQFASAKKIDTQGIMKCLYDGIERGLLIAEKSGLKNTDYVFLDGSLKAPEKFYKQKTIIGGDGKVFAISVASVIAKVARDELMEEYGIRYPQYGLEHHKGYGTTAHLQAIKKHGLSPLHRATFLTKYL